MHLGDLPDGHHIIGNVGLTVKCLEALTLRLNGIFTEQTQYMVASPLMAQVSELPQDSPEPLARLIALFDPDILSLSGRGWTAWLRSPGECAFPRIAS